MPILDIFNCAYGCPGIQYLIDRDALLEYGLTIETEGRIRLLCKDGIPISVYCIKHLSTIRANSGPPEMFHPQTKMLGRPHPILKGQVQAFKKVPFLQALQSRIQAYGVDRRMEFDVHADEETLKTIGEPPTRLSPDPIPDT